MVTRALSHDFEITGLITMRPEGLYGSEKSVARAKKTVAEEFNARGLKFEFLPPSQMGGTGVDLSMVKPAAKVLGVLFAVIRHLRLRYQRRSVIVYAKTSRQYLRLELQVISPDDLTDREVSAAMFQSLEIWQALAARVAIWSGGTVQLDGQIGIFHKGSEGAAAFLLDYGALDDRGLYQLRKLSNKIIRGKLRRVFQGFWTSRLRLLKGRDEQFVGSPNGRDLDSSTDTDSFLASVRE